jgi:hypothetical protein
MPEFADRNARAVISVNLLKAIISFFDRDLRVGVSEEVEEVIEGDLMDIAAKAHGVHYHLQIEVVLAYVEAQLIQDHLKFVLELAVISL